MADDTLKLQAEIAHLKAETKKFQQEADESLWRIRPIWFYGKWFIASCVAGLTFVYGFFSVLQPYWEFQEKLVASKQEIAAQESMETNERVTESFSRAQAKLKEQQTDFKNREIVLLKRIDTLRAKLTEIQSSQGTASERAGEIVRTLEGFKLKQQEPQASSPKLKLRADPEITDYVKILADVKKNGFSLIQASIEGDFRHDYVLEGDKIIIDRATGLMWESGGSSNTITFDKAKDYVDDLNTDELGGFSDWRLPTIVELLSLLEPKQKNGALYIDEKFNDKQRWIISADSDEEGRGWGLVFYEGKLYIPTRNFPYYVRAVRTEK